MSRAQSDDALLTQMARTITRHKLFAAGERVLAAVSGGVDSMVMLHALRKLGCPVEAAHFDHQTRHGASAEDAAFVRETCRRLGIPCHEGSESVEADAAGRSFEAYARERRYAFLLSAAKQAACAVIATAHQEDDQAETVLMGALGMTSGVGATGIAPCVERDGIRIVRPMLDCARADMEAWARRNGVAWRDDHTNREPHCTRNRVRMELLPLLETHNPRARHALARLADISRADSEYLDGVAAASLDKCVAEQGAFVVFDRHLFRNFHKAIQRRMVKLLARRMGTEIAYERVVAATQFIAEAETGRRFDCGGGTTLYITGEEAQIHPRGSGPQEEPPAPAPLNVPGETRVSGYVFRTRMLRRNALPEREIRDLCAPGRQYFDADKLPGRLHLRARKPGDRMTPFGMKQSRKLQDIMVDCRIPAHLREAVPILLHEQEILWLPGYRRSDSAPVDDTTTTVLEIAFHRPTRSANRGKHAE